MKFKNYSIDKNLELENKEEYGIEKIIKTLLKKVIEEVKREVLSEDMNEMFESMKSNGVENIDEYILNIIDEKAVIEGINVKISSRYSSEQTEELNVSSKVLSDRELKVINNSKASHENMKITRELIEEGLPLDKIEMIDISKFSSDSLLVLKEAISDNVEKEELQVLIDSGGTFGAHNIIIVREILDNHGFEAAQFASSNVFTFEKKCKIKIALEKGISLDVIKNMFVNEVDAFLMGLLIKGFSEYKLKTADMKMFKNECVKENLTFSESSNLLYFIKKGSVADIYL